MKIKVVLLLVLILAFFVSLTGAVNGLLRIEANVTMYKLYVDGVHEMTEGVWCRTGYPSTSAQPDGIVQLSLPEGYHDIRLEKEGYEDWSSQVYIQAYVTKVLHVTMKHKPQEGTLKIVVLDQDENPLPKSEVYLDGSFKGVTNSSGIFYIKGVKRGVHSIKVRWEGSFETRTVNLSEVLKTLNFTLEILKEGELKVIVLDQNSKPVLKAEILIDGIYVGETDSEGTLSKALEAGSYIVEARFESASESSKVFIKGRSLEILNIFLKIEKKGNVEVLVMDDDGNPIERAETYLDAIYKGMTDSSGRILIEDLEEGSYSLRISKSGYNSYKGNVKVIFGETQVHMVQLEKKLNLLVYGGVVLVGLLLLLLILFFASRRRGVVEEIPSKPLVSEKKKKAKIPLKTPRKGRIIPIQREKPQAKLCKICEGFLDKPGDKFSCLGCEQIYHMECARRTEICPLCGKKIEVGEER
ncbi:MAG: PEGA domain-containing protein [Candidatus Methanofastidiosia archaeon]